jgi:CRP/FNR family transcriptional regulator, cyclic AMP receptor protein
MVIGTGVTVAALRTFSMFNGVPEQSLQAIARVAMMRRVARNATIVHAGDRTDFVYLILSGSLKVLVSDEEGREVILSMLGPGELFGEMGVLDDNPRSANVAAVTPCDLVIIAKHDFKRYLQENFEVSHYIMRNLVARLRKADRKIESLALMDVYGRVARLLLDMAETVNGEQVVTRKISKQDIAKMIGASREMVSRVMKDLQVQGLIEETDGRIVLHESIHSA